MPPWTSHPAFASYRLWLHDRDHAAPPALAQMSSWMEAAALQLPDGRRLGVVEATRAKSALDHERTIASEAVVPVRPGSWHDAFNVLAWLALPRTKAALNVRHVADGASCSPNARSRLRDAATLLDESGLLLACDVPELIDLLRGQRWKPLFVERLAEVEQHFTTLVIGHGVLDKLRRPYRSLTAKALVLTMPSGGLPEPHDLEVWDRCAAKLVSAPGFGVDAGAVAGGSASRLGWRKARRILVRGPLRFSPEAALARVAQCRHDASPAALRSVPCQGGRSCLIVARSSPASPRGWAKRWRTRLASAATRSSASGAVRLPRLPRPGFGLSLQTWRELRRSMLWSRRFLQRSPHDRSPRSWSSTMQPSQALPAR